MYHLNFQKENHEFRGQRLVVLAAKHRGSIIEELSGRNLAIDFIIQSTGVQFGQNQQQIINAAHLQMKKGCNVNVYVLFASQKSKNGYLRNKLLPRVQ